MIQLVATASISIAAKQEESFYPTVVEWVSISDNAFLVSLPFVLPSCLPLSAAHTHAQNLLNNSRGCWLAEDSAHGANSPFIAHLPRCRSKT
jgi:hypothetical protein